MDRHSLLVVIKLHKSNNHCIKVFVLSVFMGQLLVSKLCLFWLSKREGHVIPKSTAADSEVGGSQNSDRLPLDPVVIPSMLYHTVKHALYYMISKGSLETLNILHDQ